MKRKEFQALSEKELKERLDELKQELMKERFQVATGKGSQKTSRIREIRRMIAKITMKLHTQAGRPAEH